MTGRGSVTLLFGKFTLQLYTSWSRANIMFRSGYIKETTHGTNFHENTAEVESDEE